MVGLMSVMICGHSDEYLRSEGDYIGSKSILDVLWSAVGNDEPCPWTVVSFYCARCRSDSKLQDIRYLKNRKRRRKKSLSQI